jgi:hypothetical protein
VPCVVFAGCGHAFKFFAGGGTSFADPSSISCAFKFVHRGDVVFAGDYSFFVHRGDAFFAGDFDFSETAST